MVDGNKEVKDQGGWKELSQGASRMAKISQGPGWIERIQSRKRVNGQIQYIGQGLGWIERQKAKEQGGWKRYIRNQGGSNE